MNFTEALDELGVEYKESGQHHHVSSGWVGVDCPWCSPGEGKFRLGYNVAYGSMSCWSCGKQSARRFLLEVCPDAAKVARIVAGIKADASFDKPLPKKLAHKLVIPPGVGKLTRPFRDYLRERRLDPKEMQRLWKLEGIGFDGGKLKWRIYIPIIYKGEFVSWTSRAIGDAGRRYDSCPAEKEVVPHKHLLYGEDYADKSKGLIVHEGPFDVYRVGPGAVCTFGTAYTPQQVNRIAKYPRRAVCFDATAEGQAAAKKLVQELSVFPGETYNVVLTKTGKDTGEADNRTIRDLRKRFLE